MDDMLDQMTPEEFDERWLADSLDPIDDSWLQAATMCAVICNKLEGVVRSFAGKPLQDADIVKPEEFLPTLKSLRKRVERKIGLSPEEMEQRWRKYVSRS